MAHRRAVILAIGLIALILPAASLASAVKHKPKPKPKPTKPVPRLLRTAPSGASRFVPVVTVGGQKAVYAAHTRDGFTVIRMNQKYVTLHLHAGTVDPGGGGWRYGSSVTAGERSMLIGAFNGGFALDYPAGGQGFESNGRVGKPLVRGLASIVTYSNGTTGIGSWGSQVPARGEKVVSVRQNLTLLVNNGHIADDVSCIENCWGYTLGGVPAVARSSLGIERNGDLVWVGSMEATPGALAAAQKWAGARRAIELDINPAWVAFDLYRASASGDTPYPTVVGQEGVEGQFLASYTRDFFTVVAR